MKFIADVMLGALARWLRTLGYDTLYFRDKDDRELLGMAEAEGRVLLTRDTGLLPLLGATPHLFIRDNEPENQLKEVVGAFRLRPDPEGYFTRCLRCNSPTIDIERKVVEGKVPEYIFHSNNDFKLCPDCDRIYWAGSHRMKMTDRLRELLPSDCKDKGGK